VITGSSGRIGRVLVRGLQHEVTPFDLPDHDARSLEDLAEVAAGHDAIVHLAWNTEIEHFRSGTIDPDNLLMALNVFRAAERTGVRRVIVASSVHADDFAGGAQRGPNALPVPDSPYGASKVFVEALGRHFAARSAIEVVSVRFGGVTDPWVAPQTTASRLTALTHPDCVALVDACLTAPEVPAGSVVVYGVSAGGAERFDLANPFGWQPHR
jgi:uronate dehydrogenase